MNLFRAMATVGGLTGVSRIAGFVRDILMASVLGAGPVADAFFVALKLPNFFRRVTAEGAFSVSFVPVYSQMLDKDGREKADAFASNVFMVMLAALSGFCLLAMCLMPWVIDLVAPGFENDGQRYDLAVELARITFPYLLMMSLTALLGGVLNAGGRFAPFAFAPVLFNLALIGALLLASLFQTPGHALAWGVLAAGVLQLGWLMLTAMRGGFVLTLGKPTLSAPVKKVMALMGPGVIGAGVMHVNLFADLIIASFLGQGSISYLYYADRLNQLPLGVIGIAIGTALLPMLSKAVGSARHDEARDLFNRAMEYSLMLALPACLALFAFAPLIIGTLFERGAFEAADTLKSAQVLMCYVAGLPAYILVKIYSTVHWARQDTKTPVRVAVVATVLNIGLSLIFMRFIGVAGIALATAIGGWIQVAYHAMLLKKIDVSFALDERFKARLVRVIGASLVMILGAYGVAATLIEFHQMVRLVGVVGAGCTIYGLSLLSFGVIKFSDLQKIVRKEKSGE